MHITTPRADLPVDHPTRDPSDHANRDRRRRGKHPRGAAPSPRRKGPSLD